jgi:uncharacterized membrane protein SpoIIM required for sporulation
MGVGSARQVGTMSPLKFEADYASIWNALQALLDQSDSSAPSQGAQAGATWTARLRARLPSQAPTLDGARLAALYRRCCEHLALAQARGYPIHLTQRLESLTQRAHRLIYRRQDFGLARLKRLVLVDFPQAVRTQQRFVWPATLLFVLPMILVGWASYRDPGFILHLLDANHVQQFDSMYGSGTLTPGRIRGADTDWMMFGYYIMNNVGIGFQCFAAGIFLGVGSAFFLVFNGLFAGAVGGYLIARGYGHNFFSFVITHGAFELTAIVLSGAAGLRLGHAMLAPGLDTRLQALKLAASEAIVVVYGVIGMLLLAAGVEAFWSSAAWVTAPVKYGVGAACWLLIPW